MREQKRRLTHSHMLDMRWNFDSSAHNLEVGLAFGPAQPSLSFVMHRPVVCHHMKVINEHRDTEKSTCLGGEDVISAWEETSVRSLPLWLWQDVQSSADQNFRYLEYWDIAGEDIYSLVHTAVCEHLRKLHMYFTSFHCQVFMSTTTQTT